MYIYLYLYVHIHTYIHTSIDPVTRSVYGSTEATQPRRTLSLFHARIQSRAPLVVCARVYSSTYTLAASSRASSPGPEPGVPIPTTVGPVHRGTELRAINLFARQPATCHCVYPHVNHYVRPRNIELAPLRIPNSPFPAAAPRNATAGYPRYPNRNLGNGSKRTLRGPLMSAYGACSESTAVI